MINCQGTRFHTVFCHFTCVTPFSPCYATAAEAYLMAATYSGSSMVFDWPSADWMLKWQLVDMQYRLPRHLPTFLVPLSSFLLDVFILKYRISWLFCTHSCGEHLIWYSLKPSMSCGSSSTHSASVLINKCIGNCISSLALLWGDPGCSEVVISESSVRSITSTSTRHIGCLNSAWTQTLYSNLFICMPQCRFSCHVWC